MNILEMMDSKSSTGRLKDIKGGLCVEQGGPVRSKFAISSPNVLGRFGVFAGVAAS